MNDMEKPFVEERFRVEFEGIQYRMAVESVNSLQTRRNWIMYILVVAMTLGYTLYASSFYVSLDSIRPYLIPVMLFVLWFAAGADELLNDGLLTKAHVGWALEKKYGAQETLFEKSDYLYSFWSFSRVELVIFAFTALLGTTFIYKI